jgi:hypothetical protein
VPAESLQSPVKVKVSKVGGAATGVAFAAIGVLRAEIAAANITERNFHDIDVTPQP